MRKKLTMWSVDCESAFATTFVARDRGEQAARTGSAKAAVSRKRFTLWP